MTYRKMIERWLQRKDDVLPSVSDANSPALSDPWQSAAWLGLDNLVVISLPPNILDGDDEEGDGTPGDD